MSIAPLAIPKPPPVVFQAIVVSRMLASPVPSSMMPPPVEPLLNAIVELATSRCEAEPTPPLSIPPPPNVEVLWSTTEARRPSEAPGRFAIPPPDDAVPWATCEKNSVRSPRLMMLPPSPPLALPFWIATLRTCTVTPAPTSSTRTSLSPSIWVARGPWPMISTSSVSASVSFSR